MEAIDESWVVHGFLFAVQPDPVGSEGGGGGHRGFGVHLETEKNGRHQIEDNKIHVAEEIFQ